MFECVPSNFSVRHPAKSHTDIFITLCLGIDSLQYHVFLTLIEPKKVVSLLNICYTESVAGNTVTLKGTH